MNKPPFSDIKRRYFEAFGDLEEEIRFLRMATACLVSLLLLVTFFLFLSAKKMPIVIRVNDVGGAKLISDMDTNNAPTSHEMIGFSKRFTARFTGYNSYTVSRDMTEALNQMTARFQKDTRKSVMESGLLSKIAQAGIDAQIEFKEGKVERDSKEATVISLVGVRRIFKYGVSEFDQEVVFRADLVLRKVARSEEVPEGLLVEDYREMLLNDISERK